MDSTANPQGGGAQLGKYTLVAEIARGGMGLVYLAKAGGPANFHKLVVVKQLKPELAEEEKFRKMFLDEAGLAARLSHRNIVQTIAVDQDGDRFFFVMEYLEGRTLHSVARLKGDKALSVPSMLRVMCDALAGLHYAHELADYDGKPLHVVHRDVSAQNVFLTYDGQVKLLDFGVAKAAGRDQTETGALKGRVACMAPEHVGGTTTIDRRADVFAAGVLLRELLTGKRLWDGQNEVEVLRELLAKRIPPLPTDENTAARIPSEVRAIIEKAMAPERDDRYRTAHAMRAALEQYVIRIDPSGSLSKVGEHISKAFAQQRANVRATIEQHVADALARRHKMRELPTLVASVPELPNAPGSNPTPSTPSTPSTPASTGTSPRQTVSGANPVHAKEIAPPPSIPARSSSPVPTAVSVPVQKRSGIGFIVGGIAVVAVAAAGAAVFVRGRQAHDTGANATIAATTTTTAASTAAGAAPTTSEAAPAVVAAGAQKPELFDMNVKATPANAQVYVDDVLSQNPWRASYAKGSSHSIRVVAPGFTPKTEQITIDGPANVTIALDRAPVVTAAAAVAPAAAAARGGPTPAAAAPAMHAKATRPGPPTPAVAAPAAPAPAPSPATPAPTPGDVFGGGKAPKRTVDTKSPYD